MDSASPRQLHKAEHSFLWDFFKFLMSTAFLRRLRQLKVGSLDWTHRDESEYVYIACTWYPRLVPGLGKISGKNGKKRKKTGKKHEIYFSGKIATIILGL